MLVEIFICLDLCTDNSTSAIYPFLTDDHSLAVYTSMITFIPVFAIALMLWKSAHARMIPQVSNFEIPIRLFTHDSCIYGLCTKRCTYGDVWFGRFPYRPLP